MLRIILSLSSLLTFFLSAQITEYFSDSVLGQTNAWYGDTAFFQLNSDKLHLNAPSVSDTAYIVTPSSVLYNAQWEFWLKLKFNPSSNNYARFYLSSDVKNVEGALYGYYLKIGGSEDEISLYRQEGNQHIEIIDGMDGLIDTSTVNIRLRVTRDSLAKWRIFADLSGGHVFSFLGSIADSTYLQAAYTGFYCRYTASRSDKFYFDSLVVDGQVISDKTPPYIIDGNIESDSSLSISFNEMIDSSALINSNYMLFPNLGQPDSVVFIQSTGKYMLFFPDTVHENKLYTLYANNISDTSGNSMNDSINFLKYAPEFIVYNDVRINELMPDPNPSQGLPQKEYIELYNRSNKLINLKDWSITDGSTITDLDHFYLFPNGYLLLCKKSDTIHFSSVQSKMGLSPWPSLNNGGDSIILYDSSMQLIDSIHYTENWYGDESKDAGGWSLELIQPMDTCPGTNSWMASTSTLGGTPGFQNAVYDNYYVREVTGPLNVNQSDTSTYSVRPSPGSIFEWTVSGGLLLSGQFSPNLNVQWLNSGQGLIGLTETNNAGCVQEVIYKIINVGAITGVALHYLTEGIQLYFDLKEFPKEDNLYLEVYNLNGQLIYYRAGKVNQLQNDLIRFPENQACFIQVRSDYKVLFREAVMNIVN
mgnify:CR=1 FL=1|tara:strand:+ start:1061 stop:2998 length:1938 start_codon:yes stop_codon:yes gene_type:complete